MIDSKWGSLSAKVKSSVTLKIVFIGMLILILQIPTFMIYRLISERENTKHTAIAEMSAKWGGRQIITGPYLVVPVIEKRLESDGKNKYEKVINHSIVILPENLIINGSMQPEIRYRGIYQAVLFGSKFQLQGNLRFEDDLWPQYIQPNREIRFQDAAVYVGISDMKGLTMAEVLLDGRPMRPVPGASGGKLIRTGFKIPLNHSSEPLKGGIAFNMTLDLNGSSGVNFYPLGVNTQLSIRSPWQAPSFQGEFLPKNREIDEKGFKAEWQITDMNRNYPQSWLNDDARIEGSDFGVDFYVPANVYQQTARAVRYSVLFIIFIMLVFLFAEALARVWIHPVQYFLIGLAIVIFYALLLALGEHMSFGASYAISALAVSLLVAGYCFGIFRKRLVALVEGTAMLFAYTLIYFMLQLEDYALVAGAITLFVLLTVLMIFTGNLNKKREKNLRELPEPLTPSDLP